MHHQSHALRSRSVPAATAALLLTCVASCACAATGASAKDVALDSPAPASQPTAVAAARQTAMAGHLAELGLALLRAPDAAALNQVVSPVSLASALGLVHAGTAGNTAQEISALIAPATAQGTAFQRDLPALLRSILVQAPELASANRIWIEAGLAKALPASYAAAVSQRYGADGMLLSFSKPEPARHTINGWAAEHTGQRITELLPTRAITPGTRLVLTNALHFRSPWATAFDGAATVDKPFGAEAKTARPVPTMNKRMALRSGVVDNATVIDIPFEGGRFSLTVAMPPKGHTLQAFATDLSGHDVVNWTRQLAPAECVLELPPFKIAPASVPLKPVLQSLGMRTAFSDVADFTPLLGTAGKSVALDNVYQSAGIAVDEAGAEAAAATAATGMLKSMARPPAPACAVDRPFLFTITHAATGMPVFLGKVEQP